MNMARLRKVGGSVMLAIPPALLDVLDLKETATVGLSVDNGKLVVTPSARKRYTLDELMDQCDLDAPESAEDIAWDRMAPVGREVI